MCGQLGDGADAACSIRQQNKDVCTRCDTAIWIHVASQQHFKWCKGCKQFLHAHSFRGGFLRSSGRQPSKCDACRQIQANPSGQPNEAHTCGCQQTNPRKGPVGKCVLTGKDKSGKDKWSFVADVVFMTKTAVPKALNRPGSRGDCLLRQDSVHFQLHHVYKTTDAENNIVYWAHKGSL